MNGDSQAITNSTRHMSRLQIDLTWRITYDAFYFILFIKSISFHAFLYNIIRVLVLCGHRYQSKQFR